MVNEDFNKTYRRSKKRGEEQHPMEINEPGDSIKEKMVANKHKIDSNVNKKR